MSPSAAVAKVTDSTIPVSPEQTLKACKALVAHIKKAAAAPPKDGKQNLLADEETVVAETPIWLTLTTKKHIHENNRLQPGKIVLPNPLNNSDEISVCLITADPQRWYKDVVADEFPEELRKKIGRVIDVTHLKAKFKAYEAQRKLFSEHDVFLADDRIINRLPKALGKTFFKTTTKRPIPVVLMAARGKVDGKRVPAPKGLAKKTKRDPAENANARPVPEIVKEVERAIGAALIHLTPSTNTAIKVGYASWEPEKLAENIKTVATEAVERFVPQKWGNIRSLFIKGPETVALPIYQTDELWLDETKVVANGEEKVSALPGKHHQKAITAGEKPNIGKKRKSLDAEPEAQTEAAPKKKAKKEKAAAVSNDDKLDKEISERKAKLKKQKAAAKKAVDV